MDANNKKRKTTTALKQQPQQDDDDDTKRPRVRAQRKFALGQGQFPIVTGAVKIPLKTGLGSGSSGSSTASGPATSNPAKANAVSKPECPKTEDFLTFLCLRGTNLLPPELDHFNRASTVTSNAVSNVSSDEEATSENGKERNVKKPSTTNAPPAPTTPIAPGAVRKSASNLMTKKQQEQAKNLPPSVRALKKKYVERRLARSVVTKSIRPVTSSTAARKPAASTASVAGRTQSQSEGMKTRSAQKLSGRRSLRPLTDASKASSVKVQSTNRKPSAASIVAKRKTRMATLTAASNRVSRMLTRLAPRATEGKKSRPLSMTSSGKQLTPGHKTLRGREISVSSEDETEAEDKKDSGSATAKKNSPPKRKLKSRKPSDSIERKGSDADEETSSRDSSRRPPNLPPPKQQNKKSEVAKSGKPRDARSESRESSNSKDSAKSGERPMRKTKEAATVYLNMLGQKLTSKKDDDVISIESLSEATQGKRLEEIIGDDKKHVKGDKYVTPPIRKKSSDENSKTADTDDTKSDVDSEKSSKKKKSAKKEKKGKHTLKELQDRLLEEAKQKMVSNPDSPLTQSVGQQQQQQQPRSKVEGDSDTGDSDERITISQRTGYIQVKPRKSIDQMSNEEQPQAVQPASIGPNGRRLSKNGERTSTPPRKILPKTSESLERSHSGSPHLPVGVVGAALSSNRLTNSPLGSAVALKAAALGQMQPVPIMANPINSMMGQNPGMNGNQQPISIAQQHGIPLTQPLVINTSFAAGNMTMSAPVQINAGQTGIIVSNTGMRMPISMGTAVQVRTSGGVPIIMPQIALPTGSIIQSMPANIRSQQPVAVCTATMVRPNYVYGPQQQAQVVTTHQPMTTSQMPMTVIQQHPHFVTTTSEAVTLTSMQQPQPLQQQQQQPSMSKVNCRSSTDVTTSNTQPLVSPGPPLLSPQIGQQQQMQQQVNQPPPQPQQPLQIPRPPAPAVTTAPPILLPSGVTVTSGAVIRSNPPKMLNTSGRGSQTHVRGKGTVQHPPRPNLPAQPIQPNLPTQPVQASLPTQPVQPNLPTQPVQPNLPTQPVQPLPLQLLPQQPINVPLQQQLAKSSSNNQSKHQINLPKNETIQPNQASVKPQQQPRTPGYGTVRSSPSRPPVTPSQQQQQHQIKPNISDLPSTFQTPPNGLLHQPPPVSLPQHPLPPSQVVDQQQQIQQQQQQQIQQQQQQQIQQQQQQQQQQIQQQQQQQQIQQQQQQQIQQQQQQQQIQQQQQQQQIQQQQQQMQQQQQIQLQQQQVQQQQQMQQQIQQHQQQQQQMQQQQQKQQAKTNLTSSNKPSSAQPQSKNHETSKQKSIFAKSSQSTSTSSQTVQSPKKEASGSKSFRVENESSPYAFEPEPTEVRPQMPYRVGSGPSPAATSAPVAHSTPIRNHPDPKPTVKKSSSSSSSSQSTPFSPFGGLGGPSIGSSIPIPEELAAQLAEQATAEGAPSGTETTYFIPLSTGTGQSFGVAVKLGTEGPPGPNQKVIMKAKLVTQPVGKTVGARVIGARTTAPGESTVELASPGPSSSSASTPMTSSAPATSKRESTFSRMPMASPISNNSSSSSSDESESDSSSSSDGDNRKSKRRRKPKKFAGNKKRAMSPDSGKSRNDSHPKPATSKGFRQREEKIPLPITSPSTSGISSAQSCLGPIEALDKFPKLGQHAHLVEAPVFKPTEKEFKDPMKYIERIRREAEPFGICKIIPPPSFKPECNVDDDMRFTAYNQYIHRMMNRWGPNAKEMAAITKYLETQNVSIKPSNHPLVGGVEIDLPALYHAVQSFGGLTEVIQKKKWGKIADFLRVPKGTQDRGNKLDDIYIKFLLPYDTLSEIERNELLRLVEEEFEEKNKKKLERSKNEGKSNDSDDSDEEEEEDEESEDDAAECVLKGKSTSLSQFFRVARNLMSMVFKNGEPEVGNVEEEYWRLVLDRDVHMQVQQGSIDTGAGRSGEEFGFPTSRGSSCGRHPWNLKILSNNSRSLLRCMGPVMGVTVPTLHVGMLFSSGCWYRDPHGLPWIEYHHTGAPKIWYGIPDSHGIAFYTAMKQLAPTFCRKKPIWLPSDTAMVPPNVLVKYNVSCCRSIQEQGQFVVVFPRAYSSNICTGYSVSESVYFATRDYLHFAEMEFKNIRDTREPMMFPLSKLILTIAEDEQTKKATLNLVKPLLEQIRDNEYVKRTMISDMGVKNTERINLKTGKKSAPEDEEYECQTCSANLYISFLCDVKEDTYYCHEHALEYLQKMKQGQRRHCKLLYTHSKEEISAIIKMVNQRLEEEESGLSDASSDEFTIRRVSEVKHQQQQLIQQQQQSQESKVLSHSTAKTTPISATSTSKASTSQARTKKESSSTTKTAKKEVSNKKRKAADSSDEDDSEESEIEVEEKKKKEEKKAKAPPTSKGKKEAAKKKVEKEKKSNKKAKKASSSEAANVPARRKTKTRKAALDKAGNLASEILDMLLSTEEESNGEEGGADSSDESWK